MHLRVIDQGLVSAARSQALYHGIAEAMRPGDAPVLTLVGPREPYVCIGVHQDLETEVDTAHCASVGLPVLRRHVGGGAVYLDSNQLFFHFIYPVALAPRRVSALYAHFVEPVLQTYRALGIPARLRPINDIHVNDRKIGGTGAAQIGEATIFVGSFLLDFDIETMTRCLRVPSEKFRDKLRSGMSDYMTTLRRELGEPPARERLVALFLQAVTQTLRVQVRYSDLRDDESAAIADWETRLLDPEWLQQPQRRRFPAGVKIHAGAHLGEASHKARGGLLRVRLLSRDGHIGEMELAGDFTCLPASGVDALGRALQGAALDDTLGSRIATHIEAMGLDMPGVEPGDLATVLRAAQPPAE